SSLFYTSRRINTISKRDWSSDVCSSDLHDVCAGRSILLHLAFYSRCGRGGALPGSGLHGHRLVRATSTSQRYGLHLPGADHRPDRWWTPRRRTDGDERYPWSARLAVDVHCGRLDYYGRRWPIMVQTAVYPERCQVAHF